ncbi:MAG: HEAT repeat domain-containing protein [Isosphaeraceae bacterium]
MIRGLRDEDEEVRSEAADRLGELGPAARRALPYLVEDVKDEDCSVRCSAIGALGRIGLDSDEVVSALEELLEEGCDETRLRALAALMALGVRPQEMMTEIVVALLDPYSMAQDYAKELLLQLEPKELGGLLPLRDAVANDPDSVPRIAIAILADFGTLNARAAEALRAEIISGLDFETRWIAVRALGRIGSEALISDLEGLLEERCDETRLLASGALLALEVRPCEMLTEIIAGLLVSTPWLKESATRILLDLGDELLGRGLPLKKALLHDPGSVSRIAVETLAELGTPNIRAAAALMDLLDDSDERDRDALAQALGRVGKGDIEVANRLNYFTQWWVEFHEEGPLEAIRALGEVSAGTGIAIPALLNILTGGDWTGELAAGLLLGDEDRALSRFKPNPDTISRLIGALADNWEGCDVQSAAEHVLRRTGSLDEETLVELLDAFRELGSRDLDPGRFERLSPRSRQLAIPALNELLSRGHCWVAPGAIRSLGRLDPASAVSHLLAREDGEDLEPQEPHDILDEIISHSSPEDILAGYRSRGWPEDILTNDRSSEGLLGLLQLCGCGGQGFMDAARRTLRDGLGDNLVPMLGKILRERYESSLKQVSIEILGDQGRAAEVLIPDLVRMLQAESDSGLRSAILKALVRISEPSEVILPLWVGLEDPDARVRSSALSALFSLGPDVGDAIHGIEAVARNPSEDPSLRSAAIEFIEAKGHCAEAVLGQPLPRILDPSRLDPQLLLISLSA